MRNSLAETCVPFFGPDERRIHSVGSIVLGIIEHIGVMV